MRGERRHDAIDILAPDETPVLSATAGRVLRLSRNGRGGLMVLATDSSERFVLLYAHLDDYADGLEAGMPLVRGQLLGYVGSSGNAKRDTPHLHFAIKRVDGSLRWSRGTAVNPYPLLTQPAPAGRSGRFVAEQAR
jgi:murein DD-endopeptidase MepM/ murein hydrolase activator NlpD